MENFEKLLYQANNRCSGIYDKDSFKDLLIVFGRLYPFTTENIAGYIDFFDLEGKSLLTTGSSADQALNAVLKGCKDITILDVNPYTKFYYYLKTAGILNFNLDEFKRFFRYKEFPTTFDDNRDVFSLDLFDMLKSDLRLLDYESYLFWDELFNNHDLERVRNEMFSNDEGDNREVDASNLYMHDNDSYLELRDIIKKIKPEFINNDFFNYIFNRKFDNIWFSNIAMYYPTSKMRELVDLYDGYLNNNGKLLISYLYKTKIDTEYDISWSEIYDFEKTFYLFKKYNPELINFTGIVGLRKKDDDIKDAVLVYKKSNASPIMYEK